MHPFINQIYQCSTIGICNFNKIILFKSRKWIWIIPGKPRGGLPRELPDSLRPCFLHRRSAKGYIFVSEVPADAETPYTLSRNGSGRALKSLGSGPCRPTRRSAHRY